jgi:hypothetical protein
VISGYSSWMVLYKDKVSPANRLARQAKRPHPAGTCAPGDAMNLWRIASPGRASPSDAAGLSGQPAAASPGSSTRCAALYRSRTRRRYCDLRFGWMSWLHQDQGSWLFACST